MSNPISKRSADADILISEISRKQPGDLLTWHWLRSLVGWDIQQNPSIISGTVANRLVRDHDIVIESVRNEGYRILTDAEVVEGNLLKDRHRRRRSAERSKRKAGTVNLAELNEGQRIKCLGEVATAHMVIEASQTKTVKKLESKIDGTGTPLSLNSALDAIKKNIGEV